MRTTLNIDDDVLRLLKKEARRSRASLTATVNRTLQLGIARLHPAERSEAYISPTFSMGFPKDVNLDKALRLAFALEDDEQARELTLRK